MKNWTVRKWPWAALLVLVLAAPAGASTFLAMSQDEMVAQSDAVVVGTVLKVESFRDVSGRVILSQAAVRVEETVVGDAPSVVLVETFGGTVDGYTVIAHGFPEFRVDDRLVLFLQNDADGLARVVGYRLGEYRLVRNRAGVDIAVPTLEPGVSLLSADGRPAERPQAVRLETLKSQIRSGLTRLQREVD